MPHSGYSRMGIIRMSPRTGEALTRLNVSEGQVLHGRVYRVEALSQTEALAGGGSKLAKIALGSLLIEAIVSEPIPEGSRVQLEVLKLADESFVLKLISVETPKQGESSKSGSSTDPARIFETLKPDIAEISPAARETVISQAGKPAAQVEQNIQPRLVEPLNLTGLPKPVITAVRTAVSEGFIDPVEFTARLTVMKETVLQVIENLQSSVRQAVQTQSQSPTLAPAAKELADSIQSLANTIRPVISSIPVEQIPLEEPVPVVAKQISEMASILRPGLKTVQTDAAVRAPVSTVPLPKISTQSPSAQPQTTTTVPASAPRSTTPTPVTQPSITPSVAPSNAGSEHSTPATTQTPASSPAPTAGRVTTPEIAAQSGPPATAQTPATTPAPATSPGTIPQAELPPAPAGTEASVVPGDSVRGTLEARSEILQPAVDQPSREILFGIRTLSLLTERLASQKGWPVEQSTELNSHASRLTSVSDAWEGTLLAPMLTRSLDAADAIPRLLMHLLFPGGFAEFGLMKLDRSVADGRKPDGESSGKDEGEYIGIIRLTTEGLGNLNVRLDFSQTDEGNVVSGRFGASEEASAVIQPAIPSLERALDARGIESGGFRVVPLGNGGRSTGSIKSGKVENNGSLDVRI